MKRLATLLVLLLLLFPTVAALASNGLEGPAPNAGDGIPDGSGFDDEVGPHSDGSGDPFGPAPNAGDGIPDGSGLTPPYGPK